MYQKPPMMSKKKRIELIILVCIIIWVIIFMINYFRYSDSKSLILAIHTTKEYDDGKVEEYISLGYIYRSYQRNSIKREELVPFWVGRENPKALPDLPVVPTDYDIPENRGRLDKYRGILYYYDKSRELVGTYKCLNSTHDCNKAFGGHDQYDTVNKDPLTALTSEHVLGTIHDKFAFVDDSVPQESEYGDLTYSRTIYLYQYSAEDPKILAKFADVKESNYDEDKEIASGDNSWYIVKSMDNNKWGVINIKESGEIEEVLPYEYESISYDADTDYYILCKDEVWYIYDLDKKEKISNDMSDPIYNVWRNANMTYYFKTGKDRTVGNDTFVDYKIYRLEDGKIFLNVDRVTQIHEMPKYIMYLTSSDNKLHFIDYSKEEKVTLQLYFSEMKHNELSHPAFSIRRETDSFVSVDIYKGRELAYDYETYGISLRTWEVDKN